MKKIRRKKRVHFIGEAKTLCGITPTIDDTRSKAWFNGMKIKCLSCDRILNNSTTERNEPITLTPQSK